MIILGDAQTMRYDTLVNWTNSNPVLKRGEIVVVVDGNNTYTKCGDGVKAFNELAIMGNVGGIGNLSINTRGDGNAVTSITLNESIMNVNKGTTFATKMEINEKQDVMSEVTNEEILNIFNS